MTEKVSTVRNPLSIIAIFAGIAEISGTAVLPLLAEDVQRVYVWFLMGFPTLLVIAFFVTLNRNHKVLYAPSDFRDDESFFRPMTPQEQLSKIFKELTAETSAKTPEDGVIGSKEKEISDQSKSVSLAPLEIIKKQVSELLEDEETLLLHLKREFRGHEFKQHFAVVAPSGKFELDAAVLVNGRVDLAIEVRRFKTPALTRDVADGLIAKIAALQKLHTRLMIAAIADFPKELHADLEKALRNTFGKYHGVEIRVYGKEELWKLI